MKINNSKVVYYEDELNDEFSTAKIVPRVIDGNFNYQKSSIWEIISFLIQNVFSVPIKFLYLKIKFHHQFIGREKLKDYQKKYPHQGVFLYANHTQPIADTMIPSMAIQPKRNFFIVNPENISMKGLRHLVELLGAIPVPGDIKSSKNFLNRIQDRVSKGYSISIYPEAHIWPYATWIRNYKSVSFRYPVKFDAPVFTITNTYQKYHNKVRMVSYIDGPFYGKENLTLKEAEIDLRNQCFEVMRNRANHSNVEIIRYLPKDKNEN